MFICFFFVVVVFAATVITYFTYKFIQQTIINPIYHKYISDYYNAQWPIFCGHSISTGTCINRLRRGAGWSFSFCRPTQEPALTTDNTRKPREWFGKKWRWMNREAEISTRKQSLKHAWLYSELLQALKDEPLSSGFSTTGSFISVSSVHYCMDRL